MLTQNRELEACFSHRDSCCPLWWFWGFGAAHLWLWGMYLALDQVDSNGGYLLFLLGEQCAFLAIKLPPVPSDRKVWLKSLSLNA